MTELVKRDDNEGGKVITHRVLISGFGQPHRCGTLDRRLTHLQPSRTCSS